MNEARFSRLIEAYGAEPARWPVAERAAAERLAADQPRLARMRDTALCLDRQLEGYRIPPPPPDLQHRIVADLLARRRISRRVRAAIAGLYALVTAGALGAGAELGATAMASVAPLLASPTSQLYEDSSFGDIGPTGSADSSSEI